MTDVAFRETRRESSGSDPIRGPQKQLGEDRWRGLDALNELFRSGAPPRSALDGPYAGELVALKIAPGLDQILHLLTRLWMPWKGKYFVPSEQGGDNIFAGGSRFVLRVVFPFYRRMVDYPPTGCRAFRFHTYEAPGRVDTDRPVLKIDYDRPDNPALSIRRILDELVQVGDGVYLGKVHFKWWWGRWQLVAYFALRTPDGAAR